MKPRTVTLTIGCALVLLAAIWFASSRNQPKEPSLPLPTPQPVPGTSASTGPTGGAPTTVTQNATQNPALPASPGRPVTSIPTPSPAQQNSGSAPERPPSQQARSFIPPEVQGERAAALIDLDKLNLMLRDYRTLFGENPVGTNAEIMKAIMGGNPKGAMLGPPEGLSLNTYGQLLDRWGTPFFFHQISKTHMEIWSAGPDKKMGTDDDVILK